MQAPLGSPTRLAGRLDRLGLCLLILGLSFAWFYFLWGRAMPALAAGLALSALIARTVHLGEKRTLAGREAALRRRIGGEMAVDSLLLQPPASAASNAAAWLSQVVALADFRPKAHGILARHDTAGLIWIACLQKHGAHPAGCDDLLACVRHARREKADLCVVCSTAPFGQEAINLSEEITPRTRLMGRDELIKLAGIAAPATNEQLRALGRRRRQKFRRELWQARILDFRKKRKYLTYGLGLTALYLFTRQVIYVIPALALLLLFALCHTKKSARFTL